jgi:hypothetical protein
MVNDQTNASKSFIWLFTKTEVMDALLAIDNKKSTGADQLGPGLVK